MIRSKTIEIPWHGAMVFLCAFLANVWQPTCAQGQLIGNRSIGTAPGSLARTPGLRGATPPNTGMPPSDQGLPTLGIMSDPAMANSRFIRGNRSRQEFVGSNRTELSGFVGSEQAIGVGRVPTAVENLRVESTSPARVNRPLPPQPAKGMYYPRLEIGFVAAARLEESLAQPIDSDLLQRVQRVAGHDVQVSVSSGRATLSGNARSKRAAELAEQLLLFEPGIDRVDNQLRLLRTEP